jgi:hypothetical protein
MTAMLKISLGMGWGGVKEAAEKPARNGSERRKGRRD